AIALTSLLLEIAWAAVDTHVLTDEVGNNWLASDGDDGQAASIPRSFSSNLSNACPNQAAPTGSNGYVLDLWGMESWASIAFPPNQREDFTIRLAVIPRADAETVWFRTDVTWSFNNYSTGQMFEQGPLTSLCDISLQNKVLLSEIEKAGLQVDEILEVKIALGNGTAELFIFNMTINDGSASSTSSPLSTALTTTTTPQFSTSSESHSSLHDTISISTTSSSSTVSALPTQGVIKSSENERRSLSKSTVVAIAVATIVALLVVAVLATMLFRRRRNQSHALGTVSPSNPRDEAPGITPFPIVQDIGQNARPEKGKPFPDPHHQIGPSAPSASGTTGEFSEDGGGTEIVRAVRRAGLTTEALLHSLGRMVPESRTDNHDGSTLPPDYARAI
ncbi:hypothetical protein BKA62DRAFT_735855, partial [Auriculariales sp. MPI-PUGE-AT-0066]